MKFRRSILFLVLAATPLSAKTLDTCFSPLGHCDQVLVSWIDAAAHTLDGAIYGLTDDAIAQAFIRAKERGVEVRLVHDRTQAAGKHDITQELVDAGIPVHIQRGTEGGILHDKFLVIDSSYVITGSFNWTTNATSKNDENFVVLDDEAPLFEKEFERLWERPPAAAPPVARVPLIRQPWWSLPRGWPWGDIIPIPPQTPYPHARHHRSHKYHRRKSKKKKYSSTY